MASAALEAFIDETIKVAAKHSYYPTVFMKMRQRHGTIESISRLVVSGEEQSGFKKLRKLGLLDQTIEAAVAKFPDEFSQRDRECAEFRLRMAQNDRDDA